MWTAVQVLIDIAFALWLILVTAAHFAGRTTSAELEVVRETLEYEIEKLEAKVDRGKIPKPPSTSK